MVQTPENGNTQKLKYNIILTQDIDIVNDANTRYRQNEKGVGDKRVNNRMFGAI